jgi:hypothetical protein
MFVPELLHFTLRSPQMTCLKVQVKLSEQLKPQPKEIAQELK